MYYHAVINKINNSEYVNFAKLLPKDRAVSEEDHRMEIVNMKGNIFLAPVADWQLSPINSFNKWEQAFHVFMNVYVKYYPKRASELILYCHTIHTASLSFPWPNVYLYDKDFRMLIARHPEHSWAIILQQAWNMRLPMKDKFSGGSGNHNNNYRGEGNGTSRTKKDHCYKFNRGKCTYGAKCKFEHKCALCSKYGHGAWNFRRGLDKGDRNRKNGEENENRNARNRD